MLKSGHRPIGAPPAHLLDAAPEETFDRVTRMVRRLLGVPVAMFSLVEPGRQFFKSAHGLDEPWASRRETPLSHSICRHVVESQMPVVLDNAASDPALQDSPAVTELGVQAYLGVPVKDAEGRVFASLCAIDRKPKIWEEEDLAVMQDLAAIVESELRLRFEITSRKEAERDLRANEARFRAIADAVPAMIWETDYHGGSIYRSRGWQEFTGQSPAACFGFGWLDAVHEEDRERLQQILIEATRSRLPFDTTYRLRRADGAWRRIADASRPHMDEDGRFLGLVGSAYDDTERREAEEAREFIGRELSHRIKNIFAMISGLIGLSARDYPDRQAFAATLRDRISALARAHEFALPHPPDRQQDVEPEQTMSLLLHKLFEPYRSEGKPGRIHVDARDITVDYGAAITLAMLLHELTTNALKYGALSVDEGHVALNGGTDGGDYVLVWQERGGPEVAGPPASSGFGTTMVQRAANLQLRAECDYVWAREGLRLTLRIPLSSIMKIDG